MQLPIYSPEDEQFLMSKVWAPQIKDDPEAFVLLVDVDQITGGIPQPPREDIEQRQEQHAGEAEE